MKALVIFNLSEHKYIILRNAERCSKGNMMKLLITAGNDAWRNDEKIRSHFGSYAEFIRTFIALRKYVPVTKVDMHFNHTISKWIIESKNWFGKYSDDDIIFADVEENYRPFAPMD